MKTKKKVVFIGTGGRANAYLMYGAKEEFDLVAVADPHAANRKTLLGLNNLVGLVKEYDDYRTMLDENPDVHGVVISTPNHFHVEPTVECLRRNLVIALEKPIAETPEGCRQILEAKRWHGGRILVGFVLRSSPFFQQAKRWIDEGRIGSVVSIQAEEIPHVLTVSVMFRSDWRRFRQFSGGMMNEKCCHDVDMLNWLAGSDPAFISSIGGVKTLAPDPSRPERCEDCDITADCTYYLPPSTYDHPDQINQANDGLLYKFTRDNSACIFNNGHDLYDHQQTLIEYRNGVTASLTVDFSGRGKTAGRFLKIFGTRGAIWGKLEENEIRLHDKRTDEVETAAVADDGSGHGGADRRHADAFIQMMDDPAYEPEATVEAAYLSSLMCFRADESVESKKMLPLDDAAGFARLNP